MGRRREPGQREYNPLDDARGRLPIESELVRDVLGDVQPPAAPIHPPQLSVIMRAESQTNAPAPPSQEREGKPSSRADDEDHQGTFRKLAVEKLTKYNKFLTTPSEKLELERLAARMSGALGVSVKSSQLIRACLIQLLHSESEIIRVAEKMDPPKRPSNAEAVALAEFDQILAALLSQGFRQTKPIKVS
jgi:hypothetical protein